VINGERAFSDVSALDALRLFVDHLWGDVDPDDSPGIGLRVLRDGHHVSGHVLPAILAQDSRPPTDAPTESAWAETLAHYLELDLYPPDDGQPMAVPADSYWDQAARAWSQLNLGTIPESVQTAVAELTGSRYQGPAFRALASPLSASTGPRTNVASDVPAALIEQPTRRSPDIHDLRDWSQTLRQHIVAAAPRSTPGVPPPSPSGLNNEQRDAHADVDLEP
jgi:hypothetical protein